MRIKSLVECCEERIETLLNLEEANYRAYEELDKKHDFQMVRNQITRTCNTASYFAASECLLFEKFDEVFLQASPSDKPKVTNGSEVMVHEDFVLF